MFRKSIIICLGLSLLASCVTGLVLADDMVVHPTGVTGHDGGNWPSTLGHLTDMLNGTDVGFLTGDHSPGIDASADTSEGTNNPAVWTLTGGYQQNWGANSKLDTNTSINAKMGWAVIDLGTITPGLSQIFFWGATGMSLGENTKEINLYYSSGVGIDTLPAMPNSKGTTGDYDFSSGDWVKLNDSGVITLTPKQPNGQPPQVTVSLGSVSARYIGIEQLNMYDNTKNRPSIGQVEITLTPPPSGTVIMIK